MKLFKKKPEFEKCKYCDWFVGHDAHCYAAKKCKHVFAKAQTAPLDIIVNAPGVNIKVSPEVHYIVCVKCHFQIIELSPPGENKLKGDI